MVEPPIIVTEVADGAFFAAPIFRRKFNEDPPSFPHHLVTFYRESELSHVPLSYVHFRAFDEVMLVGGGCTDGRGFARMSEAEREHVRAGGGLLLHALRYGFTRFADRCEAYFGYCGDARAYEVDMAAGFVPTQHHFLIAHWHRDLPAARREELIAKVHAIGPF